MGEFGDSQLQDLLAATPGERPTFVGEDVRALLRPGLTITPNTGEFRCGRATASAVDGRLVIYNNGSSVIEAIWAAAHATWWAADQGLAVDRRDALEQLR